MKYSYEKLEEIEVVFNSLLDKCNMIMGSIHHELIKILRDKVHPDMNTYIRWEFNNYLKSVDRISISKDGINLSYDGLVLHMFSDEYEDGEFEFKIPYEWLEVEDDECTDLVKSWVRNEVSEFVKEKNEKVKNAKENEFKDLISKINTLEEDELVKLLSIANAIFPIPEDFIDKWNAIGCTSFIYTKEQLDKMKNNWSV